MKKPIQLLTVFILSILVTVSLSFVIPSFVGFNKSYASDPMLIDINPGSSSDPKNLVNLNGTLYFLSNSGSNGSGLWKSDGTLAGTSLVKSINFYNIANSLVVVGNTLYIYAYGGTSDELWKSDGTTAGTVLVKDGFWSFYKESAQINGKFIFWASDGINGKEPWVSDGTTVGTVLLKDVVPGSSGSTWGSMYSAATSNKFFFMDNNQLLVTDGTVAGTSVLASGFTGDSYLTTLGESVYFWPNDQKTLWTSDGTIAGTKTVMTVGATGYEYYMVNFKGALYFWYSDSGFKLWTSNGTAAGTTFVYNTQYSLTSNSIGNMLAMGDYFYFVAADSAWSYGEELWKTDFTSSGTSMVKDIYVGNGSSDPIYLVNIGNTLYFSASVASWKNFLWQSDGTSAGTIMTTQTTTTGPTGQSADPIYLTNVNEKLFFQAYGDDYAGPNLYVLDPAPALSSDSSLSSLGISGFTMSPTFDSGTTSYTASVDSSVDSVGFTPTASFAGASITINGVSVTSGNSYQVNLVTGVNNISVVVTAEDTVSTSTYDVAVTKAPGQVKKSSISSLSALGVSGCNTSPSFNSGVTSYSCNVSSSVTSVDITATTSSPVAEVSIKGTKVTSGKAHRVNVAPGKNKVPVVVTAEDLLTTTTYNITITREVVPIVENVSTLSSLIIPEVTLSPTFDSGTTSYTGSVDSTVGSIDITPIPSSTGASVAVNGVAVEPGSPYTVGLETGTNNIAIAVTAGDPATTSTYNLVITKETPTEDPITSDPSTQNPTPGSETTTLGDVMSAIAIDISNIGKVVTKIGKSVVVVSKDVEKVVKELPISEQSSQNITAATLALVAVSPAVSVGLGSSYTIAYIARFFSMIFALFGIGRKKRNCGLVYDSVTKEPISNAIVRIYSTDGTLVATEVTNVYGIFETDIESGQYSILAQANNYRFPSMLITGIQDLPYENIYRGGNFNYDSSSSISYSIPVDPLDKSNTEYAGTIARNKLINVSSFLLNVFILVGLVFSVISYIKLNSTLNLILLLVYVFLIVLGMIMRRQEKYRFGTVTDFMGETKDGIQLGLMETEFNTIYAKRISNEKGKYRFIVPGGDYKLVSLDSQYDITSEKGLLIDSNRKVISVSNNLEATRRT